MDLKIASLWHKFSATSCFIRVLYPYITTWIIHIFWQIGVIEGLLRTNTFLQAFISHSVHLPSENYDPPLTSISSRQWEEFFAKASCACYKIAGSCKNCDKLEFMFREKNPYIMLLLGRPPTKRLWAEKINRKSLNDAPLVRLVIVLIAW